MCGQPRQLGYTLVLSKVIENVYDNENIHHCIIANNFRIKYLSYYKHVSSLCTELPQHDINSWPSVFSGGWCQTPVYTKLHGFSSFLIGPHVCERHTMDLEGSLSFALGSLWRVPGQTEVMMWWHHLHTKLTVPALEMQFENRRASYLRGMAS